MKFVFHKLLIILEKNKSIKIKEKNLKKNIHYVIFCFIIWQTATCKRWVCALYILLYFTYPWLYYGYLFDSICDQYIFVIFYFILDIRKVINVTRIYQQNFHTRNRINTRNRILLRITRHTHDLWIFL